MFSIRNNLLSSRINCSKSIFNELLTNPRFYSANKAKHPDKKDSKKDDSKKFTTSVVLKSDDSNNNKPEKDNVEYHLAIKDLEKYEDETQVVYDITDEHLKQDHDERKFKYLYQNRQTKKKLLNDPMLSKRGKKGVFDIDQMVYALKKEKIKDIAVVKIPEDIHINKCFVIGSARSTKHLESVYEYITKLYKLKKSEEDKFPHYEGKNSTNWKIMDMDIIMLHLFLDDQREFYDIEQLWCCGAEFDDKCRIKKDKIQEEIEEHAKYLEQKEAEEKDELKSEMKLKLKEHQQK